MHRLYKRRRAGGVDPQLHPPAQDDSLKRHRTWPLPFFAGIVFLGLLGWGCDRHDDPPLGQEPPVPHTLSGIITAAPGRAVDSDLNDPLAPYLKNNDPNSPQHIPNPVILAGFVTATATGQPGDRHETFPDPVDRFRVTLAENQTVSLEISDHLAPTPEVNDLDLYLYEVNTTALPNPAASSISQEAVEYLKVPLSGTYDILVQAVRGRSNYLLSISDSAPGKHRPVMRLEEDFIPDQILVIPRRKNSSNLKTPPGPAAPKLLRFDTSRSVSSGTATPPGLGNPVLLAKFRTIRKALELNSNPDYRAVSLNYRRRPMSISPNDVYYPYQWHIPILNLPTAWELLPNNPSHITLAVVDTGIFSSHPDLAGHLLDSGYDFISDPYTANDGDGIDPDPEDPGDHLTQGDSSFHGTHISGILAAATNNRIGVAGVSNNIAQVMPIRVLGIDGGSSYDLIQGARYAAGLDNDSGTVPPRPAAIINMSLGGPGYSAVEEDIFQEIRAEGIFLVSSAGNESTDIPYYPASYPGIISVSGVDQQKGLSFFSNFGENIDLAAPAGDLSADLDGDGMGDGILSTVATDLNGAPAADYAFFQGTSMAAPQVSGIIALMKTIYPDLSPDEFDAALTDGQLTEDIGVAGRDNSFGYGLIDAFKSLNAAQIMATGSLPEPILRINPDHLSFGPITNTAELSATVINTPASSDLVIEEVITDQDWLTVTGQGLGLNGLGSYSANIERAGLAAGLYSANITFNAQPAQSQIVPVSLLISDATNQLSDTGTITVSLIDEADLAEIATQELSATGGMYTFTFTNIPEGSYRIMAGSDFDHDGQTCGAGEPCGTYPNLNQPATISVTDNLKDLDFQVEFTDKAISNPAQLDQWTSNAAR